MRVWILVFALAYIGTEMVVHRLREYGWPRITWVHVAGGVTNVLLTVAVGTALVVGYDLAGEYLRRRARQRRREQARAADLEDRSPIGVASWRPAPPALPPGRSLRDSVVWAPPAPAPSAEPVYGRTHHLTQPFVEQRGPLL